MKFTYTLLFRHKYIVHLEEGESIHLNVSNTISVTSFSKHMLTLEANVLTYIQTHTQWQCLRVSEKDR